MHAKTLLGFAATSLILSACGGGGGGGTPAASASEPVIEKQAPFLFTASNGNNDYQLWKTEGTAETTSMVKVINASGNARIQDIIRIGELSFFIADDGINNDQLWVSDGTEAGTIALASEPDTMIAYKEQLFFATGDPAEPRNTELWKSDGTIAGTIKVKEINPSTSNGSDIDEFGIFGDTLYFKADDGSNGSELWKTDGTTAGTVMASNIAPGAASSDPSSLIAFGDKLFFSADDKTNGNELWSYDGNTASLVKDIYSGSNSSGPLENSAILGSKLYFTANNNLTGTELWVTDGTTAGTEIFSNLNSGSASSSPRWLTVVGDNLFFAADDGSKGQELWKTDGVNLTLVKNIRIASASTAPRNAKSGPSAVSSDPSSSPSGLFGIAGKLFFQANDGTDNELWVSDGSESGTVKLKDINTSGSSNPQHIGVRQYLNQTVATITNVGVLFSANTAANGRELWVSDGTVSGTVMVKDINPDSGDGMPAIAR